MLFDFSETRAAARKLTVVLALLATVVHGPAQTPSEPAKPSSPISLSAGLLNSMASLNDAHKLQPGDQLSLRVLEEEEPPQRLFVTDSGEMEVPLLGRIKASGKTCKSLAQELKIAYQKDYFITATVILGLDVMTKSAAAAANSRGKFFVMGQVRGQGEQMLPMDEGFTVSAAILRAGGFSEYANKRKVKIVRRGDGPDGKVELVVDMVDVMEKGRGTDPVVKPDDVIIVPEKFFSF